MLEKVHRIHGKGEKVVESLEDLKVYSGASRESLAVALAKEMSSALKLRGIKTSGSTDEIVESMLAHLPDPRKSQGNGKSFTDKKGPQEAACKQLAKIVNKHLGEDTVHLDASEGEQCEEIAEAMHSLSVGSRGEVASVKRDTTRVLGNLKAVQEMLEGNFKVLMSEIGKSEDSQLGAKTIVLQNVQKALLDEAERQEGLLRRILDVQVPKVETDMTKVLKDNKEFKSLVRKIKAVPGTGKFGEKVALTISGIGRTAAEAKIVEDALKSMGVTVDEYARAKDFGDLQDLISKSLEKNLSEKSAKKLEKWLKSANVLRSMTYKHDAIVEELKKKGGKKGKTGGDEGDSKTGGLKLTKPIERRKVVRAGLLNAFNKRMSSYVEQIMYSTESLAEAVGAKRVPVSEDLVKFTKALDIIPDLSNRYNYYALAGYNRTVESKQIRENFVSSIKHLLTAIEKLQKNKDYTSVKQLKDMHAAWTGFTKLVHDFSAKFEDGFGAIVPKPGASANSDGPEVPVTKAGETYDVDLEVSVRGVESTINAPEVARTAYNLARAKHVIKYYVRTGLIQVNMANVAKESKEYSKDYVKILADAVASLRDRNLERKNATFKLFKVDDIANEIAGLTGPDGKKMSESQRDDLVKDAKEVITFFRNSEDKMYVAAEAIDTYLMHFTDSLVAHPNDIESLHTMLKTTDTLTKWYSETSGNLICSVFESFGDVQVDDSDSKDGKKVSFSDALKSKNSLHYYEYIGKEAKPVGTMNSTIKSFDSTNKEKTKKVKQLFKDVHNVFDNVLALKNILSAFFHIGDKFGGEKVRSKIHMRPVEIYNTLVDYMTESSLNLEIDSDANLSGIKTLSVLSSKLDVGLDRLDGNGPMSDRLFEYCVKGIVAKILTVIGTYNMLNRPVDASGVGYSTDLRMILGASDSIEVYDEALELYIRIPLLAEWYRSLFNFFTTKVLEDTKQDSRKEQIHIKISMVPEVDGVYSGLVKIIFDTSSANDSGIYSETEAKDLIREINKIYLHHKSAKDPVSATIHGFVNEINRRYGILVASEREIYREEYNRRYNALEETSYSDNINYQILPDGEDTDMPRRAAPSDSYMLKGMTGEGFEPKHKWKILENDQKHLKALRWAVNKQLETIQPTPADSLNDIMNNKSFDQSIRVRAEELKHAKGGASRLKLVIDALNSFGEFSYSAIERSIVMFHETVILGLEAVNMVYKHVKEFNDRVSAQHSAIKGSSDKNAIKLDVFERLYAHANDMGELVTLRMEAVATGEEANKNKLSIYLDHSKLKEVIERELAFIKLALDRFRGLMPTEILKDYESVGTPGSIYWLENNFVNGLIHGRGPRDEKDGKIHDPRDDTLDAITNKLKEIFNEPSDQMDFKSLITKNTPAAFYPDVNTKSEGLVIYLRDMKKAKKGEDIPPLYNLTETDKDGGVFSKMFSLNDPNIVDSNITGVVVKFNQLLAMYLKQFSNEANERIYTGVVSPLANGVFSQETVEVGAGSYNATYEDENISKDARILSKVLATAMYNMVNGKMSGQRELYFLENDMAEIPEFMREKYRAQMPVFDKYFKQLSARCDMIKQWSKVIANEAQKDAIITTLDKVILGCTTACKAIKSVLGEVSDEATYMETRHGFIKDYESMNGSEPFMPLSSLVYYVNNGYIPKAFPGNSEFKIMYGTRGLLCGKSVNMKTVPGMKDVLVRHNSSSEGEFHFTESELSNHMENVVQLLRYTIDMRGIRKLLSSDTTVYNVDLNSNVVKHVLQFQPEYDALKVVELTESTHQNEQRLKILQAIGGHSKDMIYADRKTLRNYNVLDLNITPINMNALRREMPFVHLYNYAYTFDSMICDLLDVEKRIIDDIDFDAIRPGHNAYNAAKYQSEVNRKFLAWLTIHPYMKLARKVNLDIIPDSVNAWKQPVDTETKETVKTTKDVEDPLYREIVYTKSLAPTSDTEPKPKAEPKEEPKKKSIDDVVPDGATVKKEVVGPGEKKHGGKQHRKSKKSKKVRGGAETDVFSDLLDAMMRGEIGVQGLGRPKFLSEQLYNKALFGTLYDEQTTKEELGPSAYKTDDLLSYVKKSDGKEKRVDFVNKPADLTTRLELKTLGFERFNTRFVRHLIWMVNIQRLLRLKMHRDLLWHTTKITKDIAVLAPGNTELYDNDQADHNEENYKY